MSKPLTASTLPTTLGAFNPVGHVMAALPSADASAQATGQLCDAGFAPEHIVDFSARYGAQAMAEMIEGASGAAGFGAELSLMRRYLELAREGYRWLLVYAPDDAQAEQVKAIALANGAPVAVKYHLLAVEDLI